MYLIQGSQIFHLQLQQNKVEPHVWQWAKAEYSVSLVGESKGTLALLLAISTWQKELSPSSRML